MTGRRPGSIPERDPALLGALRRVAARLARDEPERLRLIQRALDAGWTHRQIAEASGLTRGRVGQIAAQRKP